MWNITKEIGILSNVRLLNIEAIDEYLSKYEQNNEIDKNDILNLFKILKFFVLNYESSSYHKNYLKRIKNIIKNKLKFIDSEKINNSLNQLFGNLETFNNDSVDRAKKTVFGLINTICKMLKEKDTFYVHSLINDYSRIIYSSAFRRLQDKAQVFPLEKYDYARTRLTHSLEVSSIAGAIGNLCGLNTSQDNEKKKERAFMFEKIMQCAACLHDIGNPPFGHFGEDSIKSFFNKQWDQLEYVIYKEEGCITQKIVTLKNEQDYEWMKSDFLRFDGNAQSLRIAAKTQIYKPRHSLELSLSVLGAIIKYPYNSLKAESDKFGYFYSEKDSINILEKAGVFKENIRNPFALILEASDDICYVTSDLDDAVKKNVITYEIFNEELALIKCSEKAKIFKANFQEFYEENKKINKEKAFELTIQRMTNDLRISLINEVVRVFCERNEDILDGIKILDNANWHEILDIIPSNDIVSWIKKNIFKKHIYNNRDIVKNELQGEKIISVLLKVFTEAVLSLDLNVNEYDDIIGKNSKNIIKSTSGQVVNIGKNKRIFSLISKNIVDNFLNETKCIDKASMEYIYYKLKLVVDYISGMTDNYAKEIYQLINAL